MKKTTMMTRWFFGVGLSVLVVSGVCPATDTNPLPDAKYEKVVREYTLLQDGRVQFRSEHRVHLYTPWAVSRHFGETFIPYNVKRQTLNVEKSVTTMVDGTQVPSPENAYNEVLVRAVDGAPAYTDLKEMVVSHTGLEKGCVVDLAYSIESEPGFYPYLMVDEVFGLLDPVGTMEVVVRVPQGTAFSYTLLNGNVHPEVASEAGFDVYTWTVNGIPAIADEPNRPPSEDFTAHLVGTTCDSWEALAGFLRGCVESKLAMDEQMERTLADLLSGCKTREGKVFRVQEWVAQTVETVDCDPQFFGYEGLPASVVFENNYGHGLDKAILLAAMLKGAGLEPALVLGSRSESVSPSVPSLTPFSTYWVAVGGMLLDPCTKMSTPGQTVLAGHTILTTAKGAEKPLEKVKMHCQNGNHLVVTGMLTLDDKMVLSGRVRLKAGRYFLPSYGMKDDTGSLIKNKMRTMFGAEDVGEINVVGFEDDAGEFTAKLGKTKSLGEKHGYVMWDLPTVPGAFDDLRISAALRERQTPLYVPTPMTETLDLDVTLASNVVAVAIPPQVDVKNAVGEVTIDVMYEKNTLKILRRLILKQHVIPPEAYPAFRELIVQWQAPDSRRVVLGVK